jgi:tetratricopeptide (TPR) repeat protein
MSAEPSFKATRAIVIDSNKALLDTTVRQLVDLGVGQVMPCRDLALARRALEKVAFDFVLCADVVEGSALTGQALLEELRRDSVLPHTTVFVMLAAKASYLSVMEAAEAALDCFLLRPFRSAELAERLVSARHRKAELSTVFEALNRGDLASAIAQCLQRHRDGASYALLCGRMAAELMLKAGQADEALALFRQLEELGQPSWSSLGVARALMAQGDISGARRQLTALVEREPDLPDALDVLGRVLVEQGNLKAALDAYRRALAVTPHCLLRLQHGGTLAFYENEPELALELLERARRMDKQSRLFDAMTLMLLALLHSDRNDATVLAQVQAALQQYVARYPGSVRLQRMAAATKALLAQAQGRSGDALALVRTLVEQLPATDFDLEAANILLSVWVRLPERELNAAEQQQLVRTIALRFCVSRATTAVLLASARRSDAVSMMVRDGHAEVSQAAEEAMRCALNGQAEAAVARLLALGGQTGNARLIMLAGQLLRRHAAQLPDAAAMGERVAALQQQHCRPITHIAGMRRTGRASGGLMVRMQPMAPATDAAPLLTSTEHEADAEPEAALEAAPAAAAGVGAQAAPAAAATTATA